MFKVLLTDYAWPDLDIECAVLAACDAELVVAPDREVETLVRLAADADAIMTTWVRVPAPVLEAATRCRIVARLGIGLDNIDVECASRRGIVVTNVPDYCLHEVAEHALALILSLGRKIAFYHLETKQGRYELQAGPPLRRISGQTLGIVGLGNIGRSLAQKALGLGLRVIGTSRQNLSQMPGVEWRTLEELLAASDYVSLHVPSTPDTRGMIGREQLARMKPTAYLINTSRGALVDETALAEALESGQIAGAALDVQQHEPPDLSKPLFNDPRVIVTPHAAFASVESLAELRRNAAQQVVDRLQGRVPRNVVNRAVIPA